MHPVPTAAGNAVFPLRVLGPRRGAGLVRLSLAVYGPQGDVSLSSAGAGLLMVMHACTESVTGNFTRSSLGTVTNVASIFYTRGFAEFNLTTLGCSRRLVCREMARS